MIKIISGLSFFTTFLALTMYLLIREKRDQDTSDGKEREFYKEKRSLIERILKESWYRKIDNYLKESDYAVSLDLYIAIHFIVVGTIIYSVFTILPKQGFVEFLGTIIRIILPILIPLNLIVKAKTDKRNNQLRLELCNIQDLMYFQSKIGTSEDVILVSAARVAKEPLKGALLYLANAPKLNKKTDEAYEKIREISKIVELQSFGFMLEQKQQTGSIEESHKAQAAMLKRNKRMRRRIIRQYRRSKLVVAALLLLGCYMLLLTVPIFQEMQRSIDIMFR